MLIREIEGGYVMISQPAHAWVAAQLARAWGNTRFGPLEPREDVILAAEQHDIGWLKWEQQPAFNPKTGRPQTFMEIPTSEHLDIWAPAGPAALVYGPYVALLVSLHGTGLYRRHDPSKDTPEEAERARRFREEGAAFERELIQAMTEVPRYAPWLDEGTISRNSKLVSVWDRMSLYLCGGSGRESTVPEVPAIDGAVTLTIIPDSSNIDRAFVDPWPFDPERVSLLCPGRRMEQTSSTEEEMLAAIDRAPWITLEIELMPR